MTHDHSSVYSVEVLTGGGAWATGGSGGRGLAFDPGSPPPALALSLVSMMEWTWSAMESRERPERVLLLLRRTSLRISLKSSLLTGEREEGEGGVGVHEYPHDNMVVWNERGFAICMAKGYGT